MEGKKISFGFTKTRRPPDTRLAAPVQSTTDEERRDYIDCVEEKAIKIVGGEVIEDKKPLVIPMKPNTLVTAERLQQIAAEVESSVDEPAPPAEAPEVPKIENETLEQQVERELLEEARNVKKAEAQVLTIANEKLPPLEGQKESTLEDYEAVPISDFGMAMLRGMGWTPGTASKYAQPVLRPKGLGLGADKLVKRGAKGGGDKDEEELKLKKACHVRVVAGKHSGAYGKVVSLDDESGRVLVELAMKRECVSVSEHMLQIVTKQHYEEQSRVINSDKYEEYKMKEQSAKERNEKSNSKKASRENAERSSRQDDNSSGRKKHENDTPKLRDSSGEDRSKHGYKESRSNNVKLRRRSSSEESKGPDAQRSKSSNGNDKYKRETRKSRERSNEDRKERVSHNEPSQSRRSPSRGDSRKDREKNARNRPSSEERTQRRSRKERRASSTSSDDNRTRRKNKSKDDSSGNESLSSSSSVERRRSKKSKKKSTSEGKRDIDKKRKGKKKKRDRDRSPNYRKHKR